LSEIGIHHQGRSKHVDEYRNFKFDQVVTVCDSAAKECPMWLGSGRRVHMGFPDPAKASGTDEEILEVFRQVRDDIAQQIPTYLIDGEEATP
jgi:arsenate reductase